MNVLSTTTADARRAYPFALRAAAGFVYFALTVRLVQVIVVFRSAV